MTYIARQVNFKYRNTTCNDNKSYIVVRKRERMQYYYNKDILCVRENTEGTKPETKVESLGM